VRFSFRRRIRHPFYPAVKPAPAAKASKDAAALYGAMEELSTAAGTGIRVRRAVFPLCRASSPFLTEPQRDALWEMFRVPIYTLLLDGDGAVVAYECEAQEGLHLREGYTVGMLFGRVETKLCECGRPGPRLMPPTPANERLAG
jgi:hypothetical protein